MSENEKKIYTIVIYAVNGAAAFLAFVFGLCYAIQISPLYGCMIMFFGILASLSFCLVSKFLFELVCEFKERNKSSNEEAKEKPDKE
ncbi:MAG: hypothetical protein K2L42_03680 [Clostridia bacterium]|nr:hypothetical protein [Clostridia bacterium]